MSPFPLGAELHAQLVDARLDALRVPLKLAHMAVELLDMAVERPGVGVELAEVSQEQKYHDNLDQQHDQLEEDEEGTSPKTPKKHQQVYNW